MSKELQVFELTSEQLERFVVNGKGEYPAQDTVVSEFLTTEEIKNKIWNDMWMVFQLGTHPLDVIPYLKSGFKIVFMKGIDYRRFKKEYNKLM
jgi:mRNA-degrading endonuclease HigB of HigAB toxin-antitoxin module